MTCFFLPNRKLLRCLLSRRCFGFLWCLRSGMLFVRLVSLLLVVGSLFSIEPPQPKRKRTTSAADETEVTWDGAAAGVDDMLIRTGRLDPKAETLRFRDLSDCPVCSATKRNTLQYAIEAYWRNEILNAYACACTHLLSKPDDGYAASIVHSLTQGKLAPITLLSKFDGPKKVAPPLRKWELLGPLPVGKLEHDMDATFIKQQSNPNSDELDVGSYILGMPSNASVYSELATGGQVRWGPLSANDNGEADVRFPSVQWNELVQGLSSMAVYEFQGWARTATFVKTPGAYIISCAGTHTVYVRNDNMTRALVADVYRSGRVSASVDLRVGLVGIAVPLRGVGQTSFRCAIEAAETRSIAVQAPQSVPDLLEFPEVPGRGFLLSSVFALPVHNLQSNPIAIDFSVEKPLGQDGEFSIREAKPLQDSSRAHMHYGNLGEITIAPGQNIILSLELIPRFSSNTTLPFLSCRKNQFQVTVIPSRGPAVMVSLALKCRRVDQSFMVSYLDHDHSISQAAVVFPLEYLHPALKQPARSTASASADSTESATGRTYPVLLSMHGSGIPAANHADAHKMMPSGHSDYVFGVEGVIVVAPSRFGAHNWEHIGERSAKHALYALQILLHNTVDVLKFTLKPNAKLVNTMRTVLPLPQVRLGSGIVSGHSMGAHGAWMLAVNHPDLFSCLAPLSGWINKEEYGTANAFFHLDGSGAFVDPQLRDILQSAMSDTHTDKLMENVLGMDVHIRVGSQDSTTHPFYSRRMHRLLQQIGVNSTYEELPGKQHWWWDTDVANDGGVLNDPRMRSFYAHCQQRAEEERTAQILPPSAAGRRAPPCRGDVTLVVVNPGTHSGRCGISVQQQTRIMSRSTVLLRCGPTTTTSAAASTRTCTLQTKNVRRLKLELGPSSALMGNETLLVDGVSFAFESDPLYLSSEKRISFCWTASNQPVLCGDMPAAASPIHQKSAVNYGPVRLVSARPFIIVYGTPKSQPLRLAMRDLAVYVGNSHAAAYSTHVRIMSDLEYISQNPTTRPALSNLVFVGGPTQNRLMGMICGLNSTSAVMFSVLNTLPMACRMPSSVDFYPGGFQFDGASFNEPGASAVFTLPFYRASSAEFSKFPGVTTTTPGSLCADATPAVAEAVGMAVCLHANSVQGYLHLSRLTWPVVPPMVRAPLETYIPDYMVLGGDLWALGMGAVRKAGFWDNDWAPALGQNF